MGFKIKETVPYGVRMLWYHGLAYHEPEKGKIVTFVIPLNWFVAAGLWIMVSLQIGTRIFSDATYHKGYEDGYVNGYHQAETEIMLIDELTRAETARNGKN